MALDDHPSMTRFLSNLCLVGHPYAPTGRGEDVRCSFRALRSVALRPSITDVYQLHQPDVDENVEFAHASTREAGAINIFHINADEVKQAVAHLTYNGPWDGYKIIYPAWELARYPADWALLLDQFDEIWAPSQFVKDSLESECKRPVHLLPLACEVVLSSFHSRRYFGVPETDYLFLFFFDVRSYSERKNPLAVIEAFRRLLKERPFSRARLVLKINGAELAHDLMKQLEENISDLLSHVTIITRLMSDNEVKNLVRCCDCFVSLHRSEGFGRGIAEAMYLGKPVVVTGYSGNMDFTNSDNSLLVPFELVAVAKDEYPHWQDQVWANPDIEVASRHMIRLVDDPEFGCNLGKRAAQFVRYNFGYRSAGGRYLTRIEAIEEKIASRCTNTIA